MQRAHDSSVDVSLDAGSAGRVGSARVRIRGNVAFEVPTGAKPVAVVFSNFGTVVKWNIP